MGHRFSLNRFRFGRRVVEPESNSIPIHHKCRNCGQGCDQSNHSNTCIYANFTRTGTSDQPLIVRPIVPNNKVRWSTSFNYHPIEFTSDKILTSTKDYVDRDPREDSNVEIPWNLNDGSYDRRSHHGLYKIVEHLPQNPCGRTGITGRGYLGHFGPNHAADPIVTRWKRDENGEKIINPYTQRPILQFVCIRRSDTNEYAIPGGMCEKNEKIADTLQREFHEEVLNFPELDETSKHELLSTIKDVFENGGSKIYSGYVDDPRNTDNSWMETSAYNFHDENDEHLGLLRVQAGTDAASAFWQDIDSQLPLFASHADFLKCVAHLRKAHW